MNAWVKAWLEQEETEFQMEYDEFVSFESEGQEEILEPCGWTDRVSLFCREGFGADEGAEILAHMCVCPVCAAMAEIYDAARIYPYRLSGGRDGLPLYTFAIPLHFDIIGEPPVPGVQVTLPLAMGSNNVKEHTVPLPNVSDRRIIFEYDQLRKTVKVRTKPEPVTFEAEIYKGVFCLSRQSYLPGETSFPTLKLRPGATAIAIRYDNRFWVRYDLKET